MSPVTPVVRSTAPFVGAERFGEHAFATQVGAVPAHVPPEVQARIAVPLSV